MELYTKSWFNSLPEDELQMLLVETLGKHYPGKWNKNVPNFHTSLDLLMPEIKPELMKNFDRIIMLEEIKAKNWTVSLDSFEGQITVSFSGRLPALALTKCYLFWKTNP